MALTRLIKKYISALPVDLSAIASWRRLEALAKSGRECSPHELALSVCVGVYVAFSPFIFLQTVLIFLCSWLFGLQVAIVFGAASLINNPWTAVPVYASDYFFGHWLLRMVAGECLLAKNPRWISWLCAKLETYVGIKDLSFWAFLVGGNVLGLLISVILYPVVRRWFSRYDVDSCGVVS